MDKLREAAAEGCGFWLRNRRIEDLTKKLIVNKKNFKL